MLGFLSKTDEVELFPHQDPEVIRLQAVLDTARRALAPARQAWNDYCVLHADELASIPFGRQKQRLYDQFTDAAWAADDAGAALTPVMESATQRATAAWNDRIRQQFLDDQPAIAALIEVLAQHEETVRSAQAAGCGHVLNAPHVFVTAEELRIKLAYAKKELGLD